MPQNRSAAALLKLLAQRRTIKEWNAFLQDLLTPRERESLAERWQIVRLLAQGLPQREVAKKLGVSISKVTRGARVLRYGTGALARLAEEG